MIINLSEIPEGWYLHFLEHTHSDVIYKGDECKPLCWTVCLQNIKGGSLKVGCSDSAQGAIDRAIQKALSH